MKQNQATLLRGTKVVLVPYRRSHVPKYHGWMQSEELQQLTASEPLTLEQEYDMQKSWREDANKCTFIVLDGEIYNKTGDEIESMVGDVNLFFNDEEDMTTAEIEVMIVDPGCRGKGLGKEAVISMMYYGMTELSMKQFTAKIGYSNKPSHGLFTKIGFTEISRSDAFEEITYELPLTEQIRCSLQEQCQQLKMEKTHSGS